MWSRECVVYNVLFIFGFRFVWPLARLSFHWAFSGLNDVANSGRPKDNKPQVSISLNAGLLKNPIFSVYFFTTAVSLNQEKRHPIPCVLIALEVNKTKSVRASLRKDQKRTVLPDQKPLHNFQKVQMTSNNMDTWKTSFSVLSCKVICFAASVVSKWWKFSTANQKLIFQFQFQPELLTTKRIPTFERAWQYKPENAF